MNLKTAIEEAKAGLILLGLLLVVVLIGAFHVGLIVLIWKLITVL